jgi:hypothetical protein
MEQKLKQLIGEQAFLILALQTQLEQAQKEIEELKKNVVSE